MVGYTLGTLTFFLSLLVEVDGVRVWGTSDIFGWWLASAFLFLLGYGYRRSKNPNTNKISFKNVLCVCAAIILLSLSIFSMAALFYYGKGMAYGVMGYLLIAIVAILFIVLLVAFIVLLVFVLKATKATGEGIASFCSELLKLNKKKEV